METRHRQRRDGPSGAAFEVPRARVRTGAMCSHETIAWEVTDNSVANRMTDNSLISKFRPSRRMSRRTKVLNAKIKKHCGAQDYRHYVELKTSVLRDLSSDTDTSDSSCLSDVDYDIIYSSPAKQARYLTRNSERYVLVSEEDYKDCKKEHVKGRAISRGGSTEKGVQKRKLSQTKATASEKCADVSWQKVKSKSSSMDDCTCTQVCTSVSDYEGDVSNNRNVFKARSGRQGLSPRSNSQDGTAPRIVKYENKCTRRNREGSNAVDSRLSSEDSTISNKAKPVSKNMTRNHRYQSTTVAESNAKLGSRHSRCRSSRSTSLENGRDLDNESNTGVKSENTKAAASNRSSIKNCDNTYASRKSERLLNARRNLTPTLDKAVSTSNNKDLETSNNVKDRLNCDQLLSAAIRFNRSDTPLRRTQNTPAIKDPSLDASSQDDQQKDSGIDEDSPDRFVNIKGSDKTATRNVEEHAEKTPILSSELKKNDKVIETAEDCKKEDAQSKVSNILRDRTNDEEKQPSRGEEIRNSLQLNQFDVSVEINQEDKKNEHFARIEDSNATQKQQLLSPRQDCMKDVHSESCNRVQEEKDGENLKKSSEQEETSLQLNKVDKDIEVTSVNQEGEGKEQADEERKENFPQLSEADKNAKMHSINQEDKSRVTLEDTHNIQQRQQLLPKVVCTETINKRYKIIDKKNNDGNSNIETIADNADIANKCTPVKKNTLIYRPNIIDYNIDNFQEAAINVGEIDAALETDNEEINVSPQTKKRLQQQARLNLVVCSDSSESDNKYVTAKTSQKHIDNSLSDTSRCNKDDRLESDEIDCVSKQTYISHGENTYVPGKTTKSKVPTEAGKLDSTMKEEIKKKAESLRRCTHETTDLFQSTTNKHPKETLYCENVHNDDRSEHDNFQLSVSKNNVLCNNEEFIDQSPKHKQSHLLDTKSMYTKNNENEEITRAEFGTRHKSEHEKNAQLSMKSRSNTHVNISCQYRPCNLQELVDDQELLVETMPTSFTLADLSENEEAFLLNVPSKVVQCNLKSQVLTLKERSIKCNGSKYKLVHKEVGTTTCIFATGKTRKPYKITNIKNMSTITVREKLPQDSRKTDESNEVFQS